MELNEEGLSEEKIKKDALIAWENFVDNTDYVFLSKEKNLFLELFRMGLKFQDRDTRHKCSEAVLDCASEEFPTICSVTKASQVCMNVQAI